LYLRVLDARGELVIDSQRATQVEIFDQIKREELIYICEAENGPADGSEEFEELLDRNVYSLSLDKIKNPTVSKWEKQAKRAVKTLKIWL
jgi:hypothetical protein